MFFEIKFSLCFSFSLSNGAATNGRERHRLLDDQNQDQEHISLPIVSQRAMKPGSMTKEPLVASAPAKPILSRFARYFRTGSAAHNEHQPEVDDTRIADTHLAKAGDRESLEILLRSGTPCEKPVTATAFNTDTSDELSSSSPPQQSPAAFLDMLPEGPFVVRQSPVLEEDSGSDLVSSVQRLRAGGLASYFADLEERASASMPNCHVSTGHGECLTVEVEADQYLQTYDMEDGDWDEMTVREVSDEE